MRGNYSMGEVQWLIHSYTDHREVRVSMDARLRAIDLQRAFKELHREDRLILFMVGVASFKHGEAARRLGIPQSTVSYQYRAALRRCTEAINGR